MELQKTRTRYLEARARSSVGSRHEPCDRLRRSLLGHAHKLCDVSTLVSMRRSGSTTTKLIPRPLPNVP